jgi:hypothetical protein
MDPRKRRATGRGHRQTTEWLLAELLGYEFVDTDRATPRSDRDDLPWRGEVRSAIERGSGELAGVDRQVSPVEDDARSVIAETLGAGARGSASSRHPPRSWRALTDLPPAVGRPDRARIAELLAERAAEARFEQVSTDSTHRR